MNLEINKYNTSRIYKLVARTLVYYGSTTKPLSTRFSIHKALYKLYKEKNKGNYCYSFLLFDSFPNEVSIELVEEVNCNNRAELQIREAHYIKNFNNINKNLPSRSRTEYYQDNKKHLLDWQNEYNNRPEIKVRLRMKFNCQLCGGCYTFQNYTHHENTKKHRAKIT